MTLKPPTRTFPKVKLADWPKREDELEAGLQRAMDSASERIDKDLSDFTRVVEETGILDQQRPQKEKSRDE